jgi:hypothetical protein
MPPYGKFGSTETNTGLIDMATAKALKIAFTPSLMKKGCQITGV